MGAIRASNSSGLGRLLGYAPCAALSHAQSRPRSAVVLRFVTRPDSQPAYSARFSIPLIGVIMGRRYSLAIGICIGLACLTLGFLLGQPSAGQAAPALSPEAKPGRYQVAVTHGQGLVVILCDTQTGQLWEKYDTGDRDWYSV